ncbi:hypothetical protein FQA39_LY16983 [Lamprigera yunnana]|nr:hypothetical protein FQA39_LY16983 [Lamprigera yunnana]
MILYVLLFAALVLVYVYLTQDFNYWKKQRVPYDKPSFLIGSSFAFVAQKVSLGEYLQSLYKKTSFPCHGFYVFDRPFLLMKDPQVVKMMFSKDFDCFDDHILLSNMKYDKVSALSLIMSKNPRWKLWRSLVAPTLSLGKVKTMMPFVIEAAEGFAEYVKTISVNQDVTECRELCFKYAIDAMASFTFGLKSNSFGNSEFYNMAHNLQNNSVSRVTYSMAYFFAPILLKLTKGTFLQPESVQFLKSVFINTVQLRKTVKTRKGDLIDRLIEIEEERDDFKMEEQGLAFALEFLTAGYVSAGLTLCFLLYELSLNESVQELVREEVKTLLKDEEKVSFTAIQEMKYLDATVKETARKYPVLPFIDRRCKKLYKISNIDVTIDKDTPVLVSLLGLHYDPRYFPNPEEFNPDRFFMESNNSAYMPFGQGQRNCVGSLLGTVIVKMAVIKLLQKFKLRRNKLTPSVMEYEHFGFILFPKRGEVNLQFKNLNQ